MTPREKGDRAKEMLDSEIFKLAFSDIRESLVAKLEACGIGDIDTQHALSVSLQLLRQLKAQLVRYSDEIAIDQATERHETWLRKARQSFMP
jgi:hypothetical protein